MKFGDAGEEREGEKKGEDGEKDIFQKSVHAPNTTTTRVEPQALFGLLRWCSGPKTWTPSTAFPKPLVESWIRNRATVT